MHPLNRVLMATAAAAVISASLLAAPAQATEGNASGGQGQENNSTAGHNEGDNGSGSPLSFAMIGDVPYGAAEIQAFPSYIQDLNAHRELSFVGHVGDIKNGSSLCTDEYFAGIRKDFDTFTLPLVYTPGDNEWTDCHRTNNGAYNPLERLAKIREIFVPQPGTTLGAPMKVKSQARQGFPENVSFQKKDIAFTAVNIPGSDNSMLPWSGLGKTAPTVEQLSEVRARTAADTQQLKEAFRKARGDGDRAVVVMTQADMFDPTVPAPSQADFGAYKPLVQTLIEESNAFGGPVYLINGDSHVYNQDHPLAAGSPWLAFYGQQAPAKNLTRVTVDGSNNAQDWLKATSTPEGTREALRFERIPFTHPAS
jgi:hypothetical protein